MKIFYTSYFKRDLANETKNLYLGYYGLRNGEFKKELKTENIFTNFHSSPINGYYIAQGINFNETGVQLSLNIPETDSSFYYTEHLKEERIDPEKDVPFQSYYQAISFYYVDLTSPILNEIKPAFILFENFNKNDLVFEDLSLLTLKNIITIPSLPDKKCNLIYSQAGLIEFFEGNSNFFESTKYIGSKISYGSRDFIESKLDKDFRDLHSGYYRTSLINKYGLKLY